MTSFVQWLAIKPRDSALDRFFEQDANWWPEDGAYGPRRFHGGIGNRFDYKTRGENDEDGLTSWVHDGYEGNDIFVRSAPTTTLTDAVSDSATTIPLADVGALGEGQHVKIDDEMILVGAISGNTLINCARGQLGTSAAAHLSGAGLYRQVGEYGRAIWYAQGQAAFFWDTDQGAAASFAAIGVDGPGFALMTFSRLDAANPNINMWNHYAQPTRGAGTLGLGSVFSKETGVDNFAGDHPQGVSYRGGRPYFQGFAGQTLGDIIQAGGHNTNAFNADNPLCFVASAGGAKFWRGVCFEVGFGENPSGQRFEAIMMPEDYTLTWYSPDDVRAFDLFSTISDGDFAQELLFGNDGLTYRLRDTGGGLFRVAYVEDAVNYWQATPAIADSAVTLAAKGVSTHISANIDAKGGLGRINLRSLIGQAAMDAVFYLKSYAVASLPAATTAGGMIFVTDETGGAVTAFSDGTNWRRTTDRAIVS